MARILYFDCISGASGDMILSALIDLGVPVKFIDFRLKRLGIPGGLSIAASNTRRNGIVCKRMTMHWNTPKTYRHLPDILKIFRKGRFSKKVLSQCELVLGRLAGAEAKAHGIPENRVHFHEIGAVDTIVDIAGICLAVDYLKIDEVRFSSLTEGHGTIHTEHGTFPVPSPATAHLIQGFHVTRLGIPTELLTPTGAALLTTLGTQSLVCPSGVVRKDRSWVRHQGVRKPPEFSSGHACRNPGGRARARPRHGLGARNRHGPRFRRDNGEYRIVAYGERRARRFMAAGVYEKREAGVPAYRYRFAGEICGPD